MIAIRDMPNTMFATYHADHEQAGQPIERRSTCACGKEFTQSLMAPRELEALERMGHITTFLRQIPDCFVPVHCPKCERQQITLQAHLDDVRSLNTPSGTYSHTLPDDRRSA